MALFSRVTTWVSNQVLTASALNGEFNNLLNNTVASSIVGFSSNAGQMQQQTDPGSVGSESLAGSASDELQRLRFMLATITGNTYWYDHSNLVTTLLANGVVTNSINASAVTTAKIATSAVTMAKLGALNYSISSSSSTYSNSTATPSDITNCTVTFTTKGNPVLLVLIPDASANTSTVWAQSTTGGDAQGFIRFMKDGSDVGRAYVRTSSATTDGITSADIQMPPGAFIHQVASNVGSTTYKVQGAITIGSTLYAQYLKLLAIELF